MAASLQEPRRRRSRPDSNNRRRKNSTPLRLVKAIQANSASRSIAASTAAQVSGGRISNAGEDSISAPSRSNLSISSIAWCGGRRTSTRVPKSGRLSNHCNRSRRRQTSPMIASTGECSFAMGLFWPASAKRSERRFDRPLPIRRRPFDEHRRGVGGFSMSDERRRKVRASLERHVDGDRSGKLGQGLRIERIRLRGIFVSGHERDGGGFRPMRERNPGERRRRQRGRHARNHRKGNSSRRQRFEFLAAAAEEQRIASLETNDAQTLLRPIDRESR